VNEGVEGFDAAVEHFRKAGEVADVFYQETGFAQGAGCSSGGDEFDAKTGQNLGKLHQACFISDAQQGSMNGFYRRRRFAHDVLPLKG